MIVIESDVLIVRFSTQEFVSWEGYYDQTECWWTGLPPSQFRYSPNPLIALCQRPFFGMPSDLARRTMRKTPSFRQRPSVVNEPDIFANFGGLRLSRARFF